MPLTIDSNRTHVVIETIARGMLARLAHDLHIEACEPRGEAVGDAEVRATFPIAKMVVVASRRHGSGPWGGPPESDRATIEQKIRTEVFPSVTEVRVTARIDGARARIEVDAQKGRQSVVTNVSVDRTAGEVRARGETTLSLSALGTGEPHVPLGAIKLEDAVRVTFDIVLVER